GEHALRLCPLDEHRDSLRVRVGGLGGVPWRPPELGDLEPELAQLGRINRRIASLNSLALRGPGIESSLGLGAVGGSEADFAPVDPRGPVLVLAPAPEEMRLA